MGNLNQRFSGGRILKKPPTKDYEMKNFDQYVKDAKILVWGLEKKEDHDTYDYESNVDRKNLVTELERLFYETVEKHQIDGVNRPAVCKGDKLGDPNNLTETQYSCFKQI